MTNVSAFFSEFGATAVLLAVILCLGDANNNPCPPGMNLSLLLHPIGLSVANLSRVYRVLSSSSSFSPSELLSVLKLHTASIPQEISVLVSQRACSATLARSGLIAQDTGSGVFAWLPSPVPAQDASSTTSSSTKERIRLSTSPSSCRGARRQSRQRQSRKVVRRNWRKSRSQCWMRIVAVCGLI